MRWHLVGGEYPPSCGGVGDYTAQLASALAAHGDEVHVWVPGAEPRDSGDAFAVHALPDHFGPASEQRLADAWSRDRGIVLLEYVPNALGAGGRNLRFCRWLVAKLRAGIDIRVMFHEPYFYFSMRRPWRNVLAIVQRRMAAALIRASARVYYSTESWSRYLGPYGAPADAATLPIPSTVPDEADSAVIAAFRHRFGGSAVPVVGHFGTFGSDIADQLFPIAIALLALRSDVRLALIGRRSDQFRLRLIERMPNAAPRIIATGRLEAREVAAALRACDVLVQPYSDGITTRRTTAMAGLQNGVATITTDGFLTERVWRETGAAALVPALDASRAADAAARLLSNAHARAEQGARGRSVYEQRFSLERTVAQLRESAVAAQSAALP
ncbi:MAG: glycosyltransferase family 4 protein [Vicinamibacterales bacterium]